MKRRVGVRLDALDYMLPSAILHDTAITTLGNGDHIGQGT